MRGELLVNFDVAVDSAKSVDKQSNAENYATTSND